MNTIFSYLYRDASNYKLFHEEIIHGELTLEQIQPYLDQNLYFIPAVIGMKALEFEVWDQNEDHDWHEIELLTLTDKEPTIELSADEIISKLKQNQPIQTHSLKTADLKGL